MELSFFSLPRKSDRFGEFLEKARLHELCFCPRGTSLEMEIRTRWVLLAMLAASACSPEYEVYSSPSCDSDADCGTFQFCDDICLGCEVLYEHCEADCRFGYTLVSERRGNCFDCVCLAQGGGGSATGGSGGAGGNIEGGDGPGLGAAPAGGSGTGGAISTGASGGVDPTGGASTGGVVECADHRQCPEGQLCHSRGQCIDCSEAPFDACPECEASKDIARLRLNGCALCICFTPNECVVGSECASGICLGGSICEDLCEDLACCYGNTCLVRE